LIRPSRRPRHHTPLRTAPATAAAVLLCIAPVLPAQDRPTAPPAHASAGSDGFSLQDESGDYRLQIRGYAHYDGRFFTGPGAGLAADGFLARRVRPILQGSLGRYVEFNFMPDFGGGTAAVQDAWVDFKPAAWARVRAGKFKSPVGLERLQSATAIHLAERAYPTSALPNRDLGLMLHGVAAGEVVSYQVAVMNGAPDGGSVDGDVNDGKDLEGRLFLSPFRRGKSVLSGLGFGVSGTRGTQTGALAAYRTGGQVNAIAPASGIAADGMRRRYSPQLSFYAGRVGLMAEFARSATEVRRASDGRRFEFETKAWQATLALAVAGGKPSFGGLRPVRPFDPAKGQWGALELAGRVHALEIGAGTAAAGLIDTARSPRKIQAWTAGVNWVLSRNLKQVVNFERSTFHGGAAGGLDRASENVFFIRTQLSF
jgi:phosphate-selective porin OprO/OprP